MSWRLRTRRIQRRPDGLRWTLSATDDGRPLTVWLDTSEYGTVLGLQSTDYIGTTGDLRLDELVIEHVGCALEQRRVVQSLDELERRRWGRVQRPAGRRRRAA